MTHTGRPAPQFSSRPDELSGFWPGVALAVTLGGIGGLTTIAVFMGWLWLVRSMGIVEADASLGASVGWWAVLWLALSAGLLATFGAAYGAWRGLTCLRRRAESARLRHEAVEAAEELVAAARATTASRERSD